MTPKTSPKPSQNRPKINQESTSRSSKFLHHFESPFGCSWSQHGPKTLPKWSQNRRKSLLKYSIVLAGLLKSSKVPLELIFGRIFMDFGSENGTKFAPKSHPICGFMKIRKKPFGASPLAPYAVRKIQVGSKNRLKIDPTMRSTWEAISASIFEGFW